MSLILDALRKSEAERQRGRAPDLFAPIADNVAPLAKPRIAFWILAIVIVLIIIFVLFWPTPVLQPQISVADDMPAAAHSGSETVAPPVVMQPEIPPPMPMPSMIASGAGKPKTATLDTAATEATTPKTEVTAPGTVDAAAAIEANPAPAPTAASIAPATDAEPALPSLAALDGTTRAALPPLQLSMHVWNEDAARRFAIIDGQRLGEGGKLAGVVVAEIRRDGVVLDISGRQFLLPRP